MKWTFGRTLVVSSLLAVCLPSFSNQAHVIPNLGSALHYHSKSIGDIYIHAGGFSHESDAKNYQAFLRYRTHATVVLIHKQHYYTVVIGPLHDAAEARKIAKNLLPKPKPMPVQHHMTKAKTKTKTKHKIQIKSKAKIIAPQPLTHVVSIQKAKPITPPKMIDPVVKTHLQTNNLSQTSSPGFFLSAGLGEQFYRVSGDNSLNTGPGWPLDHYTSDGISNQPYFTLAGGYTFARQDEWLPFYSLGIEYMYASTSTISGTIDQYSLPGFKNYNFQYDIQLMTVLATLKADIYRWRNLMPYLTLGLGVTNYATTNYTEQALKGVTPRVNPAFGANSSTNFSPSIGVGLDYALYKNLWFNLEFNYINYGKITTGNGANYATKTGTNYSNESLNNSIFATSVLLGVTFYPE